jgi:mono/diheme cytochrome c family protein
MRQTNRAAATCLVPLLLTACSGRIGPELPDEPTPPPSSQVPPLFAGVDNGYRTPDMYLPPFVAAVGPTAGPGGFPGRGPLQPTFDGSDDRPVVPGQPPVEPVPGGPAAPIIGGTLLLTGGGTIAVASDPDRSRIFVADLARAALLRELVFEPGTEPGRLAQDASGRVFAVLRTAGQLVSLAAGTFAVTDRRSVCAAPRGVAALPDGSRVYVACAGGELVALTGNGGPPLWTRTLERDLRDVVLDARGATLLVSTFRSARVLEVDLEGNPRGVLTPPAALNLTRRSRSGPEGPAATRYTPSVAWRTLAAPGGGAIVLHQRGFTGQVPAGPDVPGSSGGYGGSDCGGGLVQTVVSQVGGAAPAIASSEIASSVLTVDAALSGDGRTLAIVGPGQAHIPNMGSMVQVGPLASLMKVGDGNGCVATPGLSVEGPQMPLPWGLEQRTVGERRHLRGEAVAVGFDSQDDLVVQMREPAELVIPRRGQRIVLSNESRRQVGQMIFHADTGTGIACASCHPEGGEDGRVWRFLGLGPRRTQSLRGGVSATAPLHWDGDMLDLAHIAREVFSNRMGGPPLSEPQTDALARWIDSIPLLPVSAPADTEAVARGQALFHAGQTGCASCHSGPRLTSNLTVDVGTGRPLQVPSLLGLGARAPYLHTGCAPTLAARFSAECGGGDRHGVTSSLSSQQVSDLQAYLESL